MTSQEKKIIEKMKLIKREIKVMIIVVQGYRGTFKRQHFVWKLKELLALFEDEK